jgi:GTP:adenosylcobinamide-phosphate guanylyltransferase
MLAGGIAGGFQNGNIPTTKPLLPVRGRPIADYVIEALEQSNVEKIFILQDEDVQIQETLTASSKCVFINRDKHHSSYGLSGLYGLEKVAEYYGSPQINQKSIMIVPCDIPLATKDNFNSLILNAASKEADVTMAIIAEKRLKKRFPQKQFRSAYLADYKAKYLLQSIGFVNGKLIIFKPSGGRTRLNISFKGVDAKKLNRAEETVDIVRDHRHDYNKFLPFPEVRWIFNKGYISPALSFIFNLILNRLTTAKIVKYLYRACQIEVAFIESEEAEISADIDRPDDFLTVLGIPWDNKTIK